MKKTSSLLCALILGSAVSLAAAEPTKPAAKPAAKPATEKPATGAAKPSAEAAKPEGGAAPSASTDDTASYAIGISLGKNLAQNFAGANTELIIKGLHDGMSGAQPMFTDAEMQAAMQELQQKVMAQQQAAAKQAGEANQKAADDFLATNKTKKGVVTTASGLQYEVIKEGSGPKPKATDTVSVSYVGTLIDGTEFDASSKHGGAATFVLNQVIPGWTEGVQLMNVGSKYKFYIPPALGYGERGAGGAIGPNALLVFEVELLEIKAPPAAEPAAPAAKPAPTPSPNR